MITRDLILTGGFSKGYVSKSKSVVVQPVFAGANLAVRREVLTELGGFDGAMGTREDADLSLRVAGSKWLTFFDERAVVAHRFRATFRQMIRQWFDYGRYHARVLAKHTRPGVEIFAPTGTNRGMMSFRLPFPLRVFIPLTLFHLFHGALAGTVVALALHWHLLAAMMAALTAWIGINHFLLPFPRRERGAWIVFLCFRYAMNWAFVVGGLVGGFANGMLNIEPTHDRNGLPD